MPERTVIKPEGMSASPFFSPAIKMGQTVFVSGQAAFDNDGNIVGQGDCGRQAEYIYERIKTLLEAAGARMEHVCKTTAFITDPANYAAFNEVRSRYFPVDPPASSTVVTNLLRPDMLLEVEAIAVIPS